MKSFLAFAIILAWGASVFAGEGPGSGLPKEYWSGWRERFSIVRRTDPVNERPRYMNIHRRGDKVCCLRIYSDWTETDVIPFTPTWSEGQIVYKTKQGADIDTSYLIADVRSDPPTLSFSPKQVERFAWSTQDVAKSQGYQQWREFYIKCTTTAGVTYWLTLDDQSFERADNGNWHQVILSREPKTVFRWHRYYYNGGGK